MKSNLIGYVAIVCGTLYVGEIVYIRWLQHEIHTPDTEDYQQLQQFCDDIPKGETAQYVSPFRSDQVTDEVCHEMFGCSEMALYERSAKHNTKHINRWNRNIKNVKVEVQCDDNYPPTYFQGVDAECKVIYTIEKKH